MRKASLFTIFLTVFIDLMGFGILIPILPTFASKELGISDFAIGILFASFSLIQFLFNPILGQLSDKYGRRPTILITLLITSISYILFSFSNTFFLILLSRILAGFGGSNIAVAQAYIADVTPPHQRSKGMGMIGMAFGLGFLFGPIIGGFLAKYGYHVAGFASAGLSLLAFIFAYFSLKETVDTSKQKLASIKIKILDFQRTAEVLKSKTIGTLVLLFFVATFSGANIYGTFALLGYKVYGFTDQQIGYLFGIMGVAGAFVQGGLIRILTNKFQDKSLAISGAFIMIFGLAFMPYSHNFLGLAITISVLAIGTGIMQPVVLSMISKYSASHEQGSILGINQSLSALARVLGPFWGGFAFDYIGYAFPFLTGALFMLFTFIFSIVIFNSSNFKKMQNENLKTEKIINEEVEGKV